MEDELENFTLSLNNPSTQAEMLKVEQTQLKVTLYKDAVSDAGNGFGAYSMTRAKRDILGMSEEEIRVDLEQQRMEKAASAEMEQTSTVIKKTGVFDRVDTLYGEFGASGESGEGAEGGDAGGDTGGADFGADFGADMAGGMESAAATDAGAAEGGEIADAEMPVESTKKKENLLVEESKKKLDKKIKKYNNIYYDRLVESLDKEEKIYDLGEMDEEVDTLNNKIEEMSKEIDKIIETEEK